MWKYAIWLIFLQLCSSENVDYSDYHPKNIPLQNTLSLPSQNPSPEYTAFMSNLYDNWESPISYLQKRGYMPGKGEQKANIHVKPREEPKHDAKEQQDKSEILLRGKNYFFFPDRSQEGLENNGIMLDEEDRDDSASGSSDSDATASDISDESKADQNTSNDTTGIITKVRDKFLSIFAHNGNEDENRSDKSRLSDWNEDVFDPEFQDYDSDYESMDRRIFARSATEKPSKPPNADLFNNLSDTDIEYIKIFIDCFKQNKKDFLVQPIKVTSESSTKQIEGLTTLKPGTNVTSAKNVTTDKMSDVYCVESKPIDTKGSGAKTNTTKLIETKPDETKAGETKPGEGKPSETKAGDKKMEDSKINGTDSKTNGTDSKTNGTDSKTNGTDSKTNGTDSKTNGTIADEAKSGDTKTGQMKLGDAKPGETKPGEAKPGETKPGEAKSGEIKPGDTKPGESKTGETKGEVKPGEAKPGEAKPGETKPGEAKPGETKPGEAKPGETKPGEAKPGETKPGEAKPGDTKPAEGKPGEKKIGDGKTSETKPGEVKSGETKPGEAKTGDAKPGEAKPGEAKPGEAKPGETKPAVLKPGETKPNETKSGETKPGETKPSEPLDKTKPSSVTPKPSIVTTTPECIPIDNLIKVIKTTTVPSTTPECIPIDNLLSSIKTTPATTALGGSIGNITNTNTSGMPKQPGAGGKSIPDDFTVDLDINQKNGTGQDAQLDHRCTCIPIISTTPASAENKTKYITLSTFLAHLHHQVDEVGKPPHKPLDLKKVQEVINNSKHPQSSTVTMGDGKTTEVTPLRLNDMSFDLEWNKMDKLPLNERDKMNVMDFSFLNQPDGVSLATKFLQEAKAYSQDSPRHIDTPYGDNFLDASQSRSEDFDVPHKPSTKREAVLPNSASHSRKLSNLLSDIASAPSPDVDEDDYYSDDEESGDSLRRRVKGRMRTGLRKHKKGRFRPNSPKRLSTEGEDPLGDIDDKDNNDFNSFEELKDIQFRVSNEDEEAISKFISNLNAPPEIFSFDVDKYLRSVESDSEPEGFDFEFKSPEHRTYYEFMETPAIEKERLPVIEAPPETSEYREPMIQKNNGRPAAGKRDLLRQYIKGVSSALNRNIPDSTLENSKIVEDKSQRSPNLDNDINFRTNNLVAGFSTNLDAMNYIKSNDADDFLDNFYLLNDGSPDIYDVAKQDVELMPNDKFSPQSLEIDLDLNKKFRDLGIGSYNGCSNLNVGQEDDNTNEEDSIDLSRRKIDAEVENEQY